MTSTSRLEGHQASPDQYFARRPSVASRPATVPLVLPDRTLDLRVDRGVFSAGAVDAGTRYLLQDAPPPAAGARHLLDLGCGYGPIAVVEALRAPGATMWAVDVNERAVGLTEANASSAGAANVRPLVVPADDPVAGVDAGVFFDVIYSNPPIRIGKAAMHALLAAALQRLAPGGHAHLVVQKHLGADSLHRWLDDQGWPTTRLSSRAGYRLLQVDAAPQPAAGGPTPADDPPPA